MIFTEFNKEINKTNTKAKGGFVFKIDRTLSNKIYNKFIKREGVAVYPYFCDNQLVLLYGLTTKDDQIEFDKMQMNTFGRVNSRILKRDLIKLVHNRIEDNYLLPCNESLIGLLVHCYKERIIEDDLLKYTENLFMKQPNLKMLSGKRLETIHVNGKHINIGSKEVKERDLRTKSSEQILGFKLFKQDKVAYSEEDVIISLKDLNKKVDKIVNKIINRQHIDKTHPDTDIACLTGYLRQGLYAYKTLRSMKISEHKEFEIYRALVDVQFLTHSNLVNTSKVLYVIGKFAYIAKKLMLNKQVASLLKKITMVDNKFVLTTPEIKNIFTSTLELCRYVKEFNEDNLLPKLVVDYKLDRTVYKKFKKNSNVLPAVLSIKNGFVTVYVCTDMNCYEELSGTVKDIGERTAFKRSDLEEIIKGYNDNIDCYPFKLALSVAYVKLANNGLVGSSLLNCAEDIVRSPRNLFEYLTSHDTTNIQYSNGEVYLRIYAPCKTKGIPSVVSWDNVQQKYYTTIKFKCASWVGIDSVINLIEVVRDFENSGEFTINCMKHLDLALTNKNVLHGNRKRKHMDNIIRFYRVVKSKQLNSPHLPIIQDKFDSLSSYLETLDKLA